MVHYIYIPGLGDRFDSLRRLALQRWRRRDAQVTLVPMCWADNTETYEQKYSRVAAAIAQVHGQKIVLVGESAGGAMALLAFCRHVHEVNGVVTICGYNQGASDIMQKYRRRNPALYPLLQKLDKAMPRLSAGVRRRITTIYSTRDRVVTAEHSKVIGAHEVAVHTPGHLLTIGLILVRGIGRLANGI